MKKRRPLVFISLWGFLLVQSPPVFQLVAKGEPEGGENGAIRPYEENPRYWEYDGEPVLLLGGSKDDSLFQIPDLEPHLDLLASLGGNYIRNTMSDRRDFGFEEYPYEKLENGKYDLNRWNEEYWRRFEKLLRLTGKRDIIVQIEVWDRFDYSRENWIPHPYNPKNNVNYSREETGLADRYPEHPWRDKQPFFHTIPGMRGYEDRYSIVRKFQERFVEKMLSHSLAYGNVLYCMNNETSTSVEWGEHWMKFIREKGRQKGIAVYVTDMFDDAWKPASSKKLRYSINRPDLYPFLDVSQVNSRTFGEDHWNNIFWISEQMAAAPRPLNHTKIYSDGNTQWGSGAPQDGIERFWRNLIAGSASCRFHRPGAGIGLNETAQACIKSVREIEKIIKFWDVDPALELLTNREENEAYIAAAPGAAYILFSPDGGSVGLDLSNHPGRFRIRWINVLSANWSDDGLLEGGQVARVECPGKGPWAAAILIDG